MDGWMDGWMGGWVDGWIGGKAPLRIAYSNQKVKPTKKISNEPKMYKRTDKHIKASKFSIELMYLP